MIELIQFPRGTNFPNLSPYCVKLECYLKMANIPYKNTFTIASDKAPKKRMPYIIRDGKKIGDSRIIIAMLKKEFGDPTDKDLTPEEQAISVAFQKMLEEFQTRITAHFRWVDQAGWEKFCPMVFGKVPLPFRWIVPKLMRSRISKLLYQMDISIHSREELLQFSHTNLESISQILGAKEYFFGAKPSLLDATALSIVGNILYDNTVTDLQNQVRQFPNLIKHSERMLKIYFPEFVVNNKN